MIISQPDAMLLAWWLKQKIKRLTVQAGMADLLRQVVEALETGERIEISRRDERQERDPVLARLRELLAEGEERDSGGGAVGGDR